MKAGEQLTFEEYNLLQRSTGDLAKAVGLAFFIVTRLEFAPIMISFFPQARQAGQGRARQMGFFLFRVESGS